MKKFELKIHYTTSDGSVFDTEEEAIVHETNLFVLNLAVAKETTFEVAAFLYDADWDEDVDLKQEGFWSIHSANLSREEDYQKRYHPLGIVQGTLDGAIKHALGQPNFRRGDRIGTIKSFDIPKVS